MKIMVTGDGRVMVDYVQQGIAYSCIALANHEAKMMRDKHYPHAELFLADVPAFSHDDHNDNDNGKKRVRNVMVNRYGTFRQRACQTITQAIQKAEAAGRIVANGHVLIESIGARTTNRHTGYNLVISQEDNAYLYNALPWFVSITNEDVSNRTAKHGFKLTQKGEVSELMAAFGVWDKYAAAVETIHAFEDAHELREVYDKNHRIDNSDDRMTVTLDLPEMADTVLASIKDDVLKHLCNDDETKLAADIALDLAFEAGMKGETISPENMVSLIAA